MGIYPKCWNQTVSVQKLKIFPFLHITFESHIPSTIMYWIVLCLSQEFWFSNGSFRKCFFTHFTMSLTSNTTLHFPSGCACRLQFHHTPWRQIFLTVICLEVIVLFMSKYWAFLLFVTIASTTTQSWKTATFRPVTCINRSTVFQA